MLCAMPELVPAILAAALGVAGGFWAARRIDRLGARRGVYSAYIGAVELAGRALRMRLIAIRDEPNARPRPPMPDAGEVMGALGEMLAVAPADMMHNVERMQDQLRKMEILASRPSMADPDEITSQIKGFDDLREELVNRARRQTGERALSKRAFRDY